MAFYDYKCQECGKQVETEVICEKVTCPCGCEMKRVWTAPAIHAGDLNKDNIPKP